MEIERVNPSFKPSYEGEKSSIMVQHTLENFGPRWEILWDQKRYLPKRKELKGVGSLRFKGFLRFKSDDCRRMSWNEEHFRTWVCELTMSSKKILFCQSLEKRSQRNNGYYHATFSRGVENCVLTLDEIHVPTEVGNEV